MFRIFTLFLCISFPSTLFAVFTNYSGENSEWSGEPHVFHQKLNDGLLTEKAVEYGLEHLPFFKSNKIIAKKIEFDRDFCGDSQQLFSVVASNGEGIKDYFLKGYWDDDSMERLVQIRQSGLLELDLDNDKLSSDLPRIAFDVWSGSYENLDKKKHYLSIFKRAPGFPFERLADPTCLSKDLINIDLPIIFENWGKTMASLHFKYADSETLKYSLNEIRTRAVHEDLHDQNFFYDPGKKIFTLIDYEGFAQSLKKPRPVTDEFQSQLPYSCYGDSLLLANGEKYLPLTAAFIRGYSSIWPQSSQATTYVLTSLASCIYRELPKDLTKDNPSGKEYVSKDVVERRFIKLKQILGVDIQEIKN